jgi:hypothetical protein
MNDNTIYSLPPKKYSYAMLSGGAKRDTRETAAAGDRRNVGEQLRLM